MLLFFLMLPANYSMPDMKLIMEQWRVYEIRQLEPIKPPPRVEPELPEGPEEDPEPEYKYGADGHEYVRFPGGWTNWRSSRPWFQARWQTSAWGDLEKPRATYYLTNLTDDDPWWEAPSGTKLPDYAMRHPLRGRPHPQAIHPDLVDPSPETEASPGKPRLAMPVREHFKKLL